MNITLDGRTLNEPMTPGGTLQDLVTKVRETHLGSRMVVSIVYDGKTLLDQELCTQLSRPIEDVDQIDLVSADPYELVASAFREVANQMASAERQYEALADGLQSEEGAKALAQFGEYLQIWQTCQQAILEGSGMLGRDLTGSECTGGVVRAHLDALAEKLRDLRGAFEAGDLVWLSDLLRYELPNLCRIWRGVMSELAEQIAPAHA